MRWLIRAQLEKGETVVVTGAGGGVGMAAVDVALHLGGRGDRRRRLRGPCAALRARGVKHVVNYGKENCVSGSAS